MALDDTNLENAAMEYEAGLPRVPSIDDVIRLTANVVRRLVRDYAVPASVYDRPWFAARLHSYANQGIDAATAAFLIANGTANRQL